ncbi:MAG TPA: HEAT repeat domain-containing protein [Ktedonobacteraceae bacterium]|nr:HEAT repeat domain-containing protein [Ktedonobacteraceae bacterium]
MDTNQNEPEPARQEKQQAMDTPISFLPSVQRQPGLDSPLQEPLAALNDSDWRVRVSAVRTLERWGTRAPLPALVQALEDEDSSVRAAAVHALGMLGEQTPVERLVAALQDSDWHVRETAVLALGGLGARVPEKSLVLALKDSDSMVREAAHLVLHQRHNVVISAVEPEEASNTYEPQTTYSIVMEDSYPLEAHADKYGQLSHMDTLRQLERRKKGFLRSHWGILTVCAVLLIVTVNVTGWLTFTLVRHSAVSDVVTIQAVPTTVPNFPPATPTALPAPVFSTQALYTYHDQSASISGVAWSPDSSRIASASTDGTLDVWDASTGHRIFKWSDPYQNGLLAVAWSPDGKYIAVGGTDSQAADVYILNAHDGQIVSICPIGSLAPQASQSHIGAVRAASGGGPGTVDSLAWSHNSKWIAAGIGDGTVQVFNPVTGTGVLTISTSGKALSDGNPVASSVSWSPDNQYIAYALGSQVRLWNFTTKQLQVHIPGIANDWVTAVAWSPDNQYLAINVSQLNVGGVAAEIWSPFTGKDAIYMEHFVGSWSPDSTQITAAQSNYIQVWEASNGKVLYAYGDTLAQTINAVWSPNGNFIASGDSGGAVNVWRAP